MEFALTGQQALAKQILCPLKTSAFVKMPMLSNQDIFNVFRLIEQHNMLRTELKVGYVAVIVSNAHQKRDRVAAKCR
jgi:hypothetical protein